MNKVLAYKKIFTPVRVFAIAMLFLLGVGGKPDISYGQLSQGVPGESDSKAFGMQITASPGSCSIVMNYDIESQILGNPYVVCNDKGRQSKKENVLEYGASSGQQIMMDSGTGGGGGGYGPDPVCMAACELRNWWNCLVNPDCLLDVCELEC